MHDFTVWVSYGKWRKNWDIRYCLLHLIHLSSTRLRRCGRILSGICEPYCLITPDLTMRYCPILILISYKTDFARMYQIFKEENPRAYISNYGLPDEHLHAIRYYQAQVDNEAVLAKWRQFSKRRQMSAATPIPCSTSPVLIWNNGKKMSKPQLPTSKNAIPIKNHRLPLATYYSATGSLYFKQFIDAERWKKCWNSVKNILMETFAKIVC